MKKYLFAAVSLIGWTLVLGAAGGMEMETMSFARGMFFAALGMALTLGGMTAAGYAESRR